MSSSKIYCASQYQVPVCELAINNLKGLKLADTKSNIKLYLNKSSTELERMLTGNENQLKRSEKVIYSKFPGMSGICNKKATALAFNKARMVGCPVEFVPETFVLPDDLDKVVEAFEKQNNNNKKQHNYGDNKKTKKRKKRKETFIIKPDDGAQGDGIFLAQNFRDIEIKMSHNFNRNLIVQKYISKPMTIEGKKFDLRIYILITKLDPILELYICDEGLVRICSSDYKEPTKGNLKDIYSHLTNYSLNKHSKDFDHAENLDQGSKRTLSSFLNTLKAEGINVNRFNRQLNTLAYNTARVIKPFMIHNCNKMFPECATGRSFQILGIDVMIEEATKGDLKLHLLEINANPSISIDDVVMPEDLTDYETAIEATQKFWESGVGKPCDCKDGPKGHIHRISNVDKEVKLKVISGAISIVLNRMKTGKGVHHDAYTQIINEEENLSFKILDLFRMKYEEIIGFSTRGENFRWKPMSEFQFRKYVKKHLECKSFTLNEASMAFKHTKYKYGKIELEAFLDIMYTKILPRFIDLEKELNQEKLKKIMKIFGLFECIKPGV